MNNKIKYDRYDIKLKNRCYHILVPDMKDMEAWVTPGWIFHDDVSFIDGNEKYFQTLYEIAITLTLNPDFMVYLPLRDVKSPPYCPQGKEEFRRMDALFYNHQIQLDRRKWQVLRNMTKPLKPKKTTLKYDLDYLSECSRRLSDRYHKNKAYWIEKSDWHVYYKHYATLFVEGSRYLYAREIKNLDDFIHGKLEDAEKYGIRY